jgi:uncharacterized protein YwgA
VSDSSIRERVTNNLLLLYLIDETNKKGKMEDALKLQKMVFLSQKKFIERKLKGFSYNFFRWHKGPYSKGISMDTDLLTSDNLIQCGRDKIELTSDGKKILQGSSDLLEQNQIFLKYIDSVIDEYSKLDPETLKNKVYAMEVMVPLIRKIMTIQQIPQGRIILFKSSDKKVKRIFEMPEAWIGTLELALDSEALEFLKKAPKANT